MKVNEKGISSHIIIVLNFDEGNNNIWQDSVLCIIMLIAFLAQISQREREEEQ